MRKLTLAFSSKDGGWFGVLVDEQNRLVASAFSNEKRLVEKHLTGYARKNSSPVVHEKHHHYADEMVKLFEGRPPSDKVEVASQIDSGFLGKVYLVLTRIPRGQVTNYGAIAKFIQSGPRAVGQAVGSNPCPLFIPCHRVVPKDMTVGNYSIIDKPWKRGADVKRGILEREGIRFQGENIPTIYYWSPS